METDFRTPQKVVVHGAGGHAQELAFQLVADGWQVAAFTTLEGGPPVDGVPVITAEEAAKRFQDLGHLVGIGDCKLRERISLGLLERGLMIATFVSSRAIVAPTAEIKAGSQIFSNAVISANCVIGSGVIAGFSSIVSHDCVVGDYSTVCPGAILAGGVCLGRRVWFGVGATARDASATRPMVLGDDAFVGAGACVVSPVKAATVVAGVPARRLISTEQTAPMDRSASN